MDIQDIPYEANSFDVVIANMMLYHVPDLTLGLSEVARVLKTKGIFYSATGVKMQEYIDALEVTNMDDLMNYIYSGITWQNACKLPRSTVKQVLEKNMVDGILRIAKEYGMFICE